MSRSHATLSLQVLEQQVPTTVAEAREVANILWRHRPDFRYLMTFQDLVLEAVTEVCLAKVDHPTAKRAEHIKVAMLSLRRQLRRSRARAAVAAQTPDTDDGDDTLQRLCDADLLARVQAHMEPDEWALLCAFCDPNRNCLDIAKQRCGPLATARDIQLEHGRLRKLKRRLMRQAQQDLMTLGAERY